LEIQYINSAGNRFCALIWTEGSGRDRKLERAVFRVIFILRDKSDEVVKSLKMPFCVIPAKAGIQVYHEFLDPGFRRGDGLEGFLRDRQIRGGSGSRAFFQEQRIEDWPQ
jgi:hypothetical protein